MCLRIFVHAKLFFKKGENMRVTVRQRQDREHLQLAYTDPLTGRVKTKSSGTANWKEAERAAARWETELAAYRGTDCEWQAFRDRFEDEYLPDVRRTTARAYISALSSFEKHVGQVRSVKSIDANVCSQFASKLRESGIAIPTVAKILRHFRAALRWAESVGILDKAPRVAMPKLGNHRKAKGRPLTDAEFAKILAVVPEGPYQNAWRQFVRGLWLSGLRVSEAVALSWDDGPVRVDLAGKYPTIQFDASGQKAGRSERVPLTPDFAAMLEAIPKRNRSGRVFELPLTNAHNVSREVAAFGVLAKVKVSDKKYATAHDLRRSFGTRWALEVHPLTLRAIMRHADLKTTLDYYVDLDAEKIADDLYASMYTNSKRKRKSTTKSR